MFSQKSNSSVYSHRADSAGRRNTTFMNWLRKDRPRQVTSAIAMLSLLGSQWLTPCLSFMGTAQAAPPTAAELAEKRAAASKPPAWYLAEKKKEESRIAAMDRGMKVLLAQAPSSKEGAAAKQAKPSKPANVSNKITPRPDVVSHATILAPNSAKTWHGDSWGEVQAQSGAHILRQSLPGDVKPSAPLYQPEPRISMRKLDLSRVPTQEELSAGGGCCGNMQPAAPADPYGYARRVNQILAGQGFDGGLQTPAAGLNVGAKAVLSQAQAAVKKAQSENLEFGQAVQTWNDGRFGTAAELFQKYVEKYPKSPWTPEALIHLADNAKFHTRPAEAETIYKQVVGATSDRFGEMSYELHWKAYQHWADMYLRESRWNEARPMLVNIVQNDKYWRRRTWADNQLRGLFMVKHDKKALRAMRDCGPRALAVVFDLLHQPAVSKKLRGIPAQGPEGSSLADLKRLAAKYGLGTVTAGFAADRSHPVAALSGLPLPVILHYAYAVGQRPGTPLKPENSTGNVAPGGHFVVLRQVDASGHRVLIENPQDASKSWLTEAQLAQEWSGNGLMLTGQVKSTSGLSSVPRRLGLLSDRQMERIHGGCNLTIQPWCIGCHKRGNVVIRPSCTSCHGEPDVSVNALSQNVFIRDVPLWVHPAIGPPVEIGMSYNSQDSSNYNCVLGNKWSFEYGSHVVEDAAGYVSIFQWDGHEDEFAPSGINGAGLTTYSSPRGVFSSFVGDPISHAYTLTSQNGDKDTYGVLPDVGSQIVLLSQQDRWGKALTFHYESITVEDSSGHTSQAEVLDTITDADGGVTTLTYDSKGHIVSVRDPHERAATFTYDTWDNLVQAVDMEGHAFQYTYDGSDNVTELNTSLGPWTFQYYWFANPDAGNAVDRAWTKIWDPTQNKPEMFVLEGDNGPFTYGEGYHYLDHRGNDTLLGAEVLNGSNGAPPVVEPSFVQPSLGLALYYGYDNGAVTEPTGSSKSNFYGFDMNQDVTYNNQGMPHIISVAGEDLDDEIERTTTVNYAANGVDVTSVVNNKGETVYTVNSYNDFHQPTSITDGLGHSAEWTYTDWGAPATITTHETENSTTHVSTYHYGTGNRLSYIDRDGVTLGSYTYDDIGRVRTATGADGITLTYSYNNLDKVTRVTFPDGTYNETQYFCCSLPGAVRDRSGRMTYYDYDPLKRLSRVQDPAGQTLQYDYDEDGNCVRMVDSKGNSTRWTYDALSRVTRKSYADGRGETYNYDSPGGELVSSQDARGRTTSYSYDGLDELKGIDYPNDPAVSFSYDELGRVSSMTDGIGTTSYAYNVLSQVTSVDGPWDNDTLSFTYDSLNRGKSMSIGRGASTGGADSSSYAYDTLGRLSALTGSVGGTSIGTWNFNYSATTQRLSQLTAPNGTKTNYSYDYGTGGLGELTRVENLTDANALISRYSYGYDPARTGRRVSQTKEVADEATQTINYTYDRDSQLLGEVSTETTPTLNQTYAYDAMGNRTGAANQSGGANVAVSYTSNALNQLTGLAVTSGGTPVSNTTYGYDADGNTTAASTGTAGGGATYTYDDSDRLTCLIVKDVTSGTNLSKSVFTYDGFSRKRIDDEYNWNATTSAWDQRSEKRYLYAGMDVVQERDSSNAVTASLVRLGNIGGILSRTTSDGTFFYEYDGAGNVFQLTDGAGATVGKYWYDAYGNTTTSGTQGQLNPWRYSTKEQQETNGLYAYGFRFYDTSIGRWINRDPIKERGGTNLYSFVHNSPANRVDGRGLQEAPGQDPECGNTDPYTCAATKGSSGGGVDEHNDNQFFQFVDATHGGEGQVCEEPNGGGASGSPGGGVEPRPVSEFYVPDVDGRMPDLVFESEYEARNEAIREWGYDPDTVFTEDLPRYGKNENLKGPNGEPWFEVDVTDGERCSRMQHHCNGHNWLNEDPPWVAPGHYHGPSGNHIYYNSPPSPWLAVR